MQTCTKGVDQQPSRRARISCNVLSAVTQARRLCLQCRCREAPLPRPCLPIRVKVFSEQLFRVRQCQARLSECSSKRDKGLSRPTQQLGCSSDLYRVPARICHPPCQATTASHSRRSNPNRSVKPSIHSALKTRDLLETSSSRSCITKTLAQGLTQRTHPL